MSRSSFQEPSPDCRKCQHRGAAVKGAHVECFKREWELVEIPWDLATCAKVPCDDFSAGPRRKRVAE